MPNAVRQEEAFRRRNGPEGGLCIAIITQARTSAINVEFAANVVVGILPTTFGPHIVTSANIVLEQPAYAICVGKHEALPVSPDSGRRQSFGFARCNDNTAAHDATTKATLTRRTIKTHRPGSSA